ncbi:MAG: biotin-dependent carboxyltransferase family protein [Bacteroidota bacterium]|nr:biotin-dependent carboxyltransferase family protein [Bacteroidota bacterium]
MSLLIQKQGLSDTFQDLGRYGYQYLGVNPGGAMDTIAMRIANALVGNDPGEAVLEMYFPAAVILFEETVLVSLAGADFSAAIGEKEIPVCHPVLVHAGSVLHFRGRQKGARVYLAIQGGFQLSSWLNSCSTHLKTKTGGFQGRALQKNDRIIGKQKSPFRNHPTGNACEILHWQANVQAFYRKEALRFVAGEEYWLLQKASRHKLEDHPFHISRESDRMGFRIKGESLLLENPLEMISSAITRGTIQLLPDNQLIVLMADHQTTGGYPRIGHIISADFPTLAQMDSGSDFSLQQVTLSEAEAVFYQQELNLQQLQNACNFRLQEYLAT